jgi:sugar/nucleoside kinase (ribokinase family)
MTEIVVFGTAAVDVMVQLAALPKPGDHVAGELRGWRPGGSSANLACALASAGHQTQIVSPIGDDAAADALVSELNRCNVGTAHVVRLPAPSPRALILVDGSGERTIIGLLTARPPDPYVLPAPPDLASARCLYIENYSRCPPDIAAMAPSALIVTPLPDPGTSLGPAHIAIGSTAQLPQHWCSSPYNAARQEFGKQLRWTVVTDGAAGAAAYGPEGVVTISAPHAEQVDSTGAGDAFTAGLIHELLRGADMKTALTTGARWGAAMVERWQSFPPAWEDVFDHG